MPGHRAGTIAVQPADAQQAVGHAGAAPAVGGVPHIAQLLQQLLGRTGLGAGIVADAPVPQQKRVVQRVQKVLLNAAVAVGLGFGSGYGQGGVVVKIGEIGQVELLKLAQGQQGVGTQVGGCQQCGRPVQQPAFMQGGLFKQEPRRHQRGRTKPRRCRQLAAAEQLRPGGKGIPRQPHSGKAGGQAPGAAALGAAGQHPRGQQNDHGAE